MGQLNDYAGSIVKILTAEKSQVFNLGIDSNALEMDRGNCSFSDRRAGGGALWALVHL